MPYASSELSGVPGVTSCHVPVDIGGEKERDHAVHKKNKPAERQNVSFGKKPGDPLVGFPPFPGTGKCIRLLPLRPDLPEPVRNGCAKIGFQLLADDDLSSLCFLPCSFCMFRERCSGDRLNAPLHRFPRTGGGIRFLSVCIPETLFVAPLIYTLSCIKSSGDRKNCPCRSLFFFRPF